MFTAALLLQCASIVVRQGPVISDEQRALSLNLREIDPVILALDVEDDAAARGDNIEFLPIDPLDARHGKTHAPKVSFHHVLEYEARMDLEAPAAAQVNILERIEEPRQKIDVRDDPILKVQERLIGIGVR